MSDNEGGISPNSPMQDLIGQMNFQAAQSAAGLNLSKQMNNQLSAINMNVGKVTAAVNRVDAGIFQMLNMQKSTNMNIGKVSSGISALGKKYDETNKILSEILKSSGSNSYDAEENKLESKDVSTNIQSMTDSLLSIDAQLKDLIKNGGLGGATAPTSKIPSVLPVPAAAPGIMSNILTFGGLLSAGMSATVFGLGGLGAAGALVESQHTGAESSAAAAAAAEQGRKQRFGASDHDTVVSNPRGVGAGYYRKPTAQPQTSITDTMNALNNVSGDNLDPFNMPHALTTVAGRPDVPLSTNRFKSVPWDGSGGLVMSDGVSVPSAGQPSGAGVGLNAGMFGSAGSLETQQTRINQQSKDMTKGDMLYEATDVVYKATNVRFEASSITFSGASSQGGGSGSSSPSTSMSGPDRMFGGEQTPHGDAIPGDNSSGRKTSKEFQSASDTLQSKGVYKVGKDGKDQFAGYSDEDLRKKGVLSYKNSDGTKVYTYSPGGIGGHADRIGGAGSTESKTLGKFRPAYDGIKNDLKDDDLINIIGNESANSDESIKAVVNNMFNRLGSKSYGSAKSLSEVAKQKSQYQSWDYLQSGRFKATSPTKAARIRKIMEAVASGEEPDNTNGANEFRASSYVYGEGRGKTFSREAEAKHAPTIGGNVFLDRGYSYGPYAPYSVTGKEPPSGTTQSASAPNLGDEISGLTPQSAATPVKKGTATSQKYTMDVGGGMGFQGFGEQHGDSTTISAGREPTDDEMSTLNKPIDDNSKAIQRTEALRREQARISARSSNEKKHTEHRKEQHDTKHHNEPKNPKATRRELDSVLTRHYDWWKEWSATA